MSDARRYRVNAAECLLAAARCKRTARVRIIDSITRTAIVAPVERVSPRELTHGPSTARSLQSKRRNTVSLGDRTPARACTALVRSPIEDLA
jgi:hypothetical protein